MPLLLADTVTSALARLTNAEQKQVKMAAYGYSWLACGVGVGSGFLADLA